MLKLGVLDQSPVGPGETSVQALRNTLDLDFQQRLHSYELLSELFLS